MKSADHSCKLDPPIAIGTKPRLLVCGVVCSSGEKTEEEDDDEDDDDDDDDDDDTAEL